MICWRCGHTLERHTIVPFGCDTCWYARTNKSKFYKHEFEDNLTFIERKAKEKKLA